MSLAEIETQEFALNENERAWLAVSLLEMLPAEEEGSQGDADLDSGRGKEISHEEFIRRVEQDHHR